MRTRIGTQLILGMGLVTGLSIALMAVVTLKAQRTALVAQMTRSADQLSETIQNSARDSMLENRQDRLHRQIEAIGRGEGIDRIRLFDKKGTIVISSDSAEIGTSVEPGVETRPEHTRIFNVAEGQRMLGIARPIRNEPGCSAAACHAHDPGEKLLGVLDITMPLGPVDRQIARSEARIAGLALLTLLASGLLLWWLNRRLVVRPVEALAAGTRRVAEGDLTTAIPVEARHELGDLARAFNAMTRRLVEAQRQLAQADKLSSLGRLAAGVAHEINNPLTGVLTYGSFLLKRAEGNPELKQDLEIIVRETKRCREIVKGLLDFARQTPLRRQPTDLQDVARRAVAVVMNQLTLHRVALALDLAPDLPLVSADANQLQQVFVNLLLNAVDAVADSGGSIRLAATRAALPAWGHAPVRRATCPRGCDLMDREFRIGGLPAIRATRACGGRETNIHLDPVYGRFNHHVGEACEEGALQIFGCPHCRVPLEVPERRCPRCSAPVFSVLVPGEGAVEWCTRQGCNTSRWETQDAAGARPVVELVVEDNGPGINSEAMAHLFEPFFSTKGGHGTGLGLAVSWGIVEGHGGTIDVWSETGRGTRFTVRLPLEPVEVHQTAAA